MDNMTRYFYELWANGDANDGEGIIDGVLITVYIWTDSEQAEFDTDAYAVALDSGMSVNGIGAGFWDTTALSAIEYEDLLGQFEEEEDWD